ncbi:dTDP-4-dehydrorhamnose reductase [subsurface metagenome]
MRVLILGAKGMLGTDLAKTFADFELKLWDKEEIDICNKKQVFQKISGNNPEVIINAAAYTAVDDCEKNKNIAFKVNGTAVGFIAEIAQKIKAILVHFSTDYVFLGNKKAGYKEAEIPKNPKNIYGQSKLLGEKLLREKCKKYYLIRTSWLFGLAGKNFVETMLQLAEKTMPAGRQEKQLKVVSDQHGKPTFTKDLAKSTQKLILEKMSFGVYHIINQEPTSWYEFAKKIFELSKINVLVEPITSDQFPRPAKRPKWSILNNTKFPKLRSHKAALKEYLKLREE